MMLSEGVGFVRSENIEASSEIIILNYVISKWESKESL